MANNRNWNSLRPGISRRDFVNGSLAGLGGALLASPGVSGSTAPFTDPASDWYGYGGVGDYRLSHGNTPELVSVAHQIRNGRFNKRPTDVASSEEYDLVIVG